MEELINKLVEKTGVSEETAKKVAEFIKEHADEIPKWIGKSGLADKIPGLDKLF